MPIIFSELEQTFFWSNEQEKATFKNQTIQDITLAISKNVEFIFCTSLGAFTQILTLANKLKLKYIITSNGASIYDLINQKFIFTQTLESAIVKQILNYSQNLNLEIIWWDQKTIYSNGPISLQLKKKLHNSWIETSNIQQKQNIMKGILKMELHSHDPKKIALFLKTVQLPIEINQHSTTCLEIMAPKTNFKFAIRKLITSLNLGSTSIMAVGASKQFEPILKWADHGYVLDNASSKLKKLGLHYSSDVSQNGLGMAIIDFLHRQKLDR